MAVKFTKGSRAQAVDELGRWCNARVVQEDEGDGILVSFPGYPGHDLYVREGSRIRSTVLPYEQQHRQSCLQRGKRKVSKKCSRQQLKFLLECKQGDSIETEDGRGIIHTVDPFNRCLTLEDGALVNLHDVILSEAEEQPAKRRKRRGQLHIKKTALHDQEGCSIAPATDQSMEGSTNAQYPSTLQPCMLQEGLNDLAFKVGHYQCGKVHEVQQLGIKVMISNLDVKTKTSVCWPLVQDAVQQDIKIEMSIAHLTKTEVPVKGAAKRLASDVAKAAFLKTKANLEDPSYRKYFRMNQVTEAFLREISAAFWTTSRRRNFDIGLLCIDVDCETFGLAIPHATSAEFSYSKDTLGKLDNLPCSLGTMPHFDGDGQIM